MDLEEARKSLSKPAGHSTKRLAFLGVAGLCVVAGLVWRSGLFSSAPEAEPEASVAVEAPVPAEAPAPAVEATEAIPKNETVVPETAAAPDAPAAPPASAEPAAQPAAPDAPPAEPVEQAEPAEPAGDAVEQAAEDSEMPGQGMILVSRQPVAMLASPSADASAMYGFPAGRPFRVIGREGSYAKIVDLKSGASGWIEAAALAPPPRAPTVSAPSQPKRTTGGSPSDPQPKAAARRGGQVAAESEPAPAPSQPQSRDRPGVLFGPGGIFGGIFGGN